MNNRYTEMEENDLKKLLESRIVVLDGAMGTMIQRATLSESDFRGADTIYLNQNYRSTKTILNAANSVIKHNKLRKDKNLWSNNEIGNKVYFAKFTAIPKDTYTISVIQKNFPNCRIFNIFVKFLTN